MGAVFSNPVSMINGRKKYYDMAFQCEHHVIQLTCIKFSEILASGPLWCIFRFLIITLIDRYIYNIHVPIYCKLRDFINLNSDLRFIFSPIDFLQCCFGIE